MAVRVRQSRQRNTILEILRNSRNHPTAEMVYEEAQKEIPDISLGTVYRNLNFLADNDMILRVKGPDQNVHFDGDIAPHYHYFCQECGTIIDVYPDDRVYKKLIKTIEKSAGEVHYTNMSFVGTCKECALREE